MSLSPTPRARSRAALEAWVHRDPMERGGDDNRAEDLFPHHRHMRAGVGQHNRLYEVATIAEPAATRERAGAIAFPRLGGMVTVDEEVLGYLNNVIVT